MQRIVRYIADHKRVIIALAMLVLLIIAANRLAGEIALALRFEVRPSNEDLVHRALMTAAITYFALIAIPFVPAVEIGLALIAVFGPAVVFLVYVSTIAGLSLSFLVGRLISLPALGWLLHELRFRRASALLARLESMDTNARLALLVQSSPSRAVPVLLRHRYLALAIALNLPGNFVIGGGGGIALTAGVSRLYSVAGFLLTVSIAVAPVPLAVLIYGKEILGS